MIALGHNRRRDVSAGSSQQISGPRSQIIIKDGAILRLHEAHMTGLNSLQPLCSFFMDIPRRIPLDGSCDVVRCVIGLNHSFPP